VIAVLCAPSRTEFALADFTILRAPQSFGHQLCVALALSAAQTAAGIREAITMTTETWTLERVEQLRTCVNAGLTCSQIANQIGVSRNAVIGKIHRLGLAPGRPAAGPARERPPRVRPPRCHQRRHLRVVVSDAPRIANPAALATIERAAIESAQPCSLLELAQNKCRWPISDPGEADFAFCGNDSIGSLSYCSGHARMAYRIPARRRA
jgi:GcrA cell cycle regulator